MFSAIVRRKTRSQGGEGTGRAWRPRSVGEGSAIAPDRDGAGARAGARAGAGEGCWAGHGESQSCGEPRAWLEAGVGKSVGEVGEAGVGAGRA